MKEETFSNAHAKACIREGLEFKRLIPLGTVKETEKVKAKAKAE